MRARKILSCAGALLLACGIASHAQGAESDTAPEHKGNTGWTGGAQDHPSKTGESSGTTGQNTQDATAQSSQDAEAASTQPLTATGADLNGQPRRFPPTKTPE